MKRNKNKSKKRISWLGALFAGLFSFLTGFTALGHGGMASAQDEYKAEQTGVRVEYLDQSGQPVTGTIARITMSFKNTGTVDWNKKTKIAKCEQGELCLGTYKPRDRVSIYGNKNPNNLVLSWISDSRPTKMDQQQVKPGETATFTFFARVPGTSQSDNMKKELFVPVVEGVTWLDVAPFSLSPVEMDIKSSYGYSVESIQLGDEFIANGGSVDMVGGQSVSVEVKLKNTGKAIWDQGGDNNPQKTVYLGLSDGRSSSEFASSNWVSPSRAATLQEPKVKTGETGTFRFYMSLPTREGSFFERFRLLAGETEWINNSPEIGFGFRTEKANYSYELVSVSPLPQRMEAGEPYRARVNIKNTGNATWNRNDPSNPNIVLSKIATSSPYDRASQFYTEGEWENMTRASILTQERVFPGQIGTFEFTVVAPFAGGEFVEYFTPIVEYVTWMQGEEITLKTSVTAPQFGYTGINQYTEIKDDPRFPMKPGERKEHWVILRNDSNFTWRKYGGIRGNVHWASSCSPHIQKDDSYNMSVCGDFLAGKAHPDRRSVFYDPITWVSRDRLGTFMQDTVKPGENAEFRYTLKAPNTPIGGRREYFRLVTELVSWFPDNGYYFEPVVTGAEKPSKKVYNTSQELNVNGKTIKIPEKTGKVGIEQHLPVNDAELAKLKELANLYAQWKSAEKEGNVVKANQVKDSWKGMLQSIENEHYSRSGTSETSRNGFAGASYGSAGVGAFYPPSSMEVEKYYVNMRWPYVEWRWDGSVDTSNKEKLSTMRGYKEAKLLVTNKRTGKSVVASIAEAGPAPWTGTCFDRSGNVRKNLCPNASSADLGKYGITNPKNTYKPDQIPVVDSNNDGVEDSSVFDEGGRAPRVAGLSPEAFEAIGANLDDIIEVGFLLDQSIPLGPVQT
jgi:hypothetical protein